jgi:transcriptional regulator with XRE-family HTH domain
MERSEFGLRLFQARKHAGLSQLKLAQKVGLSQNNVSHLELKGLGSPKVESLAQACGVRVAWLARGEGPMIDPLEERSPARNVVEETAARYATSDSPDDFRAIAYTLAEALDKAGLAPPIGKFLELVDATYRRLRHPKS